MEYTSGSLLLLNKQDVIKTNKLLLTFFNRGQLTILLHLSKVTTQGSESLCNSNAHKRIFFSFQEREINSTKMELQILEKSFFGASSTGRQWYCLSAFIFLPTQLFQSRLTVSYSAEPKLEGIMLFTFPC